ncbi:hypothetical protein B0T19DRAFT_61060 [Cercophora scortea]|uniref:Uncharacterized protein n=1 Tax=Cercophora scortea TaxID=314031 RepID=A0AAE0J557_9PEZI|nr:hypothetical protein B0T19DRAFT_61060 [Cercophora scortea]
MKPPDKYRVVQNYPSSVLPAPPRPLPADTMSAMALRQQQDNRGFQGRIEHQETFFNYHHPPQPGANMNDPHLGSNGHHPRHQPWPSQQYQQDYPNGSPSHISGAVYTKTSVPDEDNWNFREDETEGRDGLIDRILARFGRNKNSRSKKVVRSREPGNAGENNERKKGGRLRRTGRALCRILGIGRPPKKDKGKQKIQIVRSPRSTTPLHDLMITAANREAFDPDYVADGNGDRGFQHRTRGGPIYHSNGAALQPFPPTPPLRYDEQAYYQGSSRNPHPINQFASQPYEPADHQSWNRPMDHPHPTFRPKLTLSTVQESDDWAHDAHPSQNRNYSHHKYNHIHNHNYNPSPNPNTNTFLNPATNPALSALYNPSPSQHDYAPSSTAPTARDHRSRASRRGRKKREAVPGRFASSWSLSQQASASRSGANTNTTNTGPSPHPIADAHAGGAVFPTIPERFSSRLPWMRSRSSWASVGASVRRGGANSYSSGAPSLAPSLTDSRRTSWNPFNLPGPPRQPLFGDMDLLSLPPLLSSLKGGSDTPRSSLPPPPPAPAAAMTTRASAAPTIKSAAGSFATITAAITPITAAAIAAAITTIPAAVAAETEPPAAAAAADGVQTVPNSPAMRSPSPVSAIPSPPAAVSRPPSVAPSSPPARCSTFGARSAPLKPEPEPEPEPVSPPGSPVARVSAYGLGAAVYSGSPATRNSASAIAGSPATGRSSAAFGSSRCPAVSTRASTSAEYSNKVSTCSSRAALSSQNDSGVDGLHVHLRKASGNGYNAGVPVLDSVTAARRTTMATPVDSLGASKEKEREETRMGREMERKSSFVTLNPAGVSRGKEKEHEESRTARTSTWAPPASVGAASKDSKDGLAAARQSEFVPLDQRDTNAVREAWWKNDRRRMR